MDRIGTGEPLQRLPAPLSTENGQTTEDTDSLFLASAGHHVQHRYDCS